MTGDAMREAREGRKWTQAVLARKLGVSQAYLSLLESNRRVAPSRLVARLVAVLKLSPAALPANKTTPLAEDRVAGALGALGYPGFAHVKQPRTVSPAELVVRTLRRETVDARLVEALPWVLARFPDVDWPWLVLHAKQHDVQNRLGFVVTMARELATRWQDASATDILQRWERVLEGSRLQKEDAFGGSALTDAERRWLRTHRSSEAAHWNLLSNLSADMVTRA